MSRKNYNRRSFLKSGGATAVGLTLGGASLLKLSTLPVRAATSPNRHWEDADFNSVDSAGTEYRNTASHSAGWYGSFFVDAPPYYGAWKHVFRHSSNARTGSVYNGNEAQSNHISQHQTTYYAGADDLTSPNYSQYNGVAPTPSGSLADNANYEKAYWVAEYALTECSAFLSLGFDAVEFIDVMIDEENTGSGGDFQDDYDYTYNHPDTGHYRWMQLYVNPGNLAYYQVTTSATDAFMNPDPSTSIYLEIEGSDPPTDDTYINPTSSTVKTSDQVSDTWMTTQDTLMYEREDGVVIEQIPVDKISSRGKTLGLSSEEVTEMKDFNEPVYFAHDMPITRTD
jgi:hypothetical protein